MIHLAMVLMQIEWTLLSKKGSTIVTKFMHRIMEVEFTQKTEIVPQAILHSLGKLR